MGRIIEIKQPKQRKVIPEVIVYRNHAKNLADLQFDASRYAYSINTFNDVDGILATARLTFTSAIAPAGLNIGHNQFYNLMKVKVAVGSIITIKIDGRTDKPDFLGMVDRIYEGKVSDGSSVGRTVNINCSLLLPKLLIKDSIPNSPVLSADKEYLEPRLGKERLKFWTYLRGANIDAEDYPFNKPPINGIKWVLENMPGTNIINSPLQKTVKEILDGNVTDADGVPIFNFEMLNNEIMFDPSSSVFFGTVYEYLRKFLDNYFYELFFDTVKGKNGEAYNQMTIRTKPYSYSDSKKNGWKIWNDLDTVVFKSEYRIREELGTDDFELKNFFSTTYTSSLIANQELALGKLGVMFPIINLASIKEYGLREIAVNSTNLNIRELTDEIKKKLENGETPTEEEKGKEFEWLLNKRDKVFEWNVCNELFDKGTLTALGNSGYRIGRKLFYQDKEYWYPYDDMENKTQKFTGVEYYIKNVAQSWTYGAEWHSTMQLTRGQAKGVIEKHIKALEAAADTIYKKNNLEGKTTATTPIDTSENRDNYEKDINGLFNIA
ncbi:MAG: hypothetical protein M0P61_00455 [Ignavibacteriaceae bacterium]|jgi:hypothetical protein|nr:hypothetical protein [Ignavibacteriaceae bacterium]